MNKVEKKKEKLLPLQIKLKNKKAKNTSVVDAVKGVHHRNLSIVRNQQDTGHTCRIDFNIRGFIMNKRLIQSPFSETDTIEQI